MLILVWFNLKQCSCTDTRRNYRLVSSWYVYWTDYLYLLNLILVDIWYSSGKTSYDWLLVFMCTIVTNMRNLATSSTNHKLHNKYMYSQLNLVPVVSKLIRFEPFNCWSKKDFLLGICTNEFIWYITESNINYRCTNILQLVLDVII